MILEVKQQLEDTCVIHKFPQKRTCIFLIRSRVKFRGLQNISVASQQNSVTARSWTAEVDGESL